MASAQPAPAMWTVRFRRHRTTVILLVDPLQNVASIKAELLSALRQTVPEGTLQGHSLPGSPDEILLARPVDINDAAAGWALFQATTGDGAPDRVRPTGKGKAKAGTAAHGVDAESLKSLGVKDNALLAFKFASEHGTTPARHGGAAEREMDGDKDDEDMMSEDAPDDRELWDVIMPSWEDQYGVDNQGDAGALKDFDE